LKRSLIRTKRTRPDTGFLWNLIDPIDWLTETIFSILIFLIFTLAFRFIWFAGDTEYIHSPAGVKELLTGALGAVLAWGIIDGVMYLLISMFERDEKHHLLRKVQAAASDEEAIELIADDLDYILEPITSENDRQALYTSILGQLKQNTPRQIGLKKEDFINALGHVLVAIAAVIPSAIPLFVLQGNYDLAIWVSISVSFLMLFLAGFYWGRYTGTSTWKTGLILAGIAGVLVLIAIPLGG
jgi:hypothetical protein